jgi:imidazolonepropionase-like amidohydrolase
MKAMRIRRSIVIAILAACGAAAPLRAQRAAAPPAAKATLAIVGGFLIDGFGGPPRPNAVVLVENDRIVAVGDEGRLPVPASARVIDANGLTVMPGLIDAHVHLDIMGHGEYVPWHDMVRANYAEVMELSAAQALAHGVTTVRDAGGELSASVRTRDRINRGEIPGPRLLISGGWIENWPEEQAKRNYRHMNLNAHTVEEARQAARTLLDGGVDFIKLYTGITLEQAKAVTEEAHKRSKRVSAHVYTDDEIHVAVEGGVDLLDHAGSGHQNPLFREDTIRMMVVKQVPIAQSIAHRVALYPAHLSWPERLDSPQLRQELGRFADPIRDSLRDWTSLSYFGQIHLQMRVAPKAARQLNDAGCRIIVGTDAGSPGFFHSEAVWREVDALVRLAGLTPNEALMSATRLAAAALGLPTGAIAPGRLADIILVKGNPLDSPLYLQNVERVIKGGVVVEPRATRASENK